MSIAVLAPAPESVFEIGKRLNELLTEFEKAVLVVSNMLLCGTMTPF